MEIKWQLLFLALKFSLTWRRIVPFISRDQTSECNKRWLGCLLLVGSVDVVFNSSIIVHLPNFLVLIVCYVYVAIEPFCAQTKSFI